MCSCATNPANITQGAKTEQLLAAVKQKYGKIPNLMRGLAASPQALEGYLGLSDAISHGRLSAKDRERIALVVAQFNGCEYCLSAHTAGGKAAGLTAGEIRDSRMGSAVDPKSNALVQFTRNVLQSRGKVSDAEMGAFRSQGWSDADLAEVAANIAAHVLTNYFNNISHTESDYPKAEPIASH